MASQENHPKVIELLLRRGADKYKKTIRNVAPEDIAKQRSHLEVLVIVVVIVVVVIGLVLVLVLLLEPLGYYESCTSPIN